jgi:hypothetical protein
MFRSVIFVLIFISFAFKSNAEDQDSVFYTNHISDQKIKTVQLYKDGWNLSYPIIKLNSTEKLVLNFDLMGNEAESYYYTFIHCDKDWNKSDIFPNEYLTGDIENPIEDYGSSFNTTVSYIHYRLVFPNERANLTRSGNYIIIIYASGKQDEPSITQRFIITEDAAKINITAHRPMMTKDNNSSQQIDFTVNTAGLSIPDPYRNTYACVLQNGRWDNLKKNLKPDFYGDNELKYNSLSDKNIFRGGNEFRYFDIKSIRYQTEYVKSIDFASPYYNVFLYPSENREFKPYFYWKDFNGKYFIAFQEGKKPDIESDYVNVYFTLPSDQPVTGGNIYVSGALNNWVFDKNNLMSYNAGKKQYECTMLLKQGWYNYEIAYLKSGDSKATTTMFEGSHYETENDYIVLVYCRNPRDRYDRVIGTGIANTLNKLTN